MNTRTAKPLLLSFVLAGLFVMPVQAQSVPKDYRDWSVSCSNIKTCTAVSISGLNEMGVSARPRGVRAETEMGWLWLELEAGPSAKPKIIYSAMFTSAQPTPKDGSLRIVGRDGRPLANGNFTLTPDQSGASLLPSADVDRFIALAKSGHAVVYSIGASRQAQSFASLSGFVAALRAIEMTQGRTGTAAAWIDKGKSARERVPPAPAAPRVNAVAFSKLSARTTVPKSVLERRKAECDDSERYDPGGQGIEGFNLGKGRILWSVPCGAGAYNAWSKFYLQQGNTSVMPHPFLGPEHPASDEDAHSLVNVSIEPETGQISAFSKGRGIADCGTAETHTWDGTRFVVTTLIEMNACSGLMPDFWPQRIKTEVIPPAKAKR